MKNLIIALLGMILALPATVEAQNTPSFLKNASLMGRVNLGFDGGYTVKTDTGTVIGQYPRGINIGGSLFLPVGKTFVINNNGNWPIVSNTGLRGGVGVIIPTQTRVDYAGVATLQWDFNGSIRSPWVWTSGRNRNQPAGRYALNVAPMVEYIRGFNPSSTDSLIPSDLPPLRDFSAGFLVEVLWENRSFEQSHVEIYLRYKRTRVFDEYALWNNNLALGLRVQFWAYHKGR